MIPNVVAIRLYELRLLGRYLVSKRVEELWAPSPKKPQTQLPRWLRPPMEIRGIEPAIAVQVVWQVGSAAFPHPDDRDFRAADDTNGKRGQSGLERDRRQETCAASAKNDDPLDH